jgi:hypothetical protein
MAVMEKHEVLVIPPVSERGAAPNSERRPSSQSHRCQRMVRRRAACHPAAVDRGSDVSDHHGVQLFCENLTRYLEGLPLENVIDWERGY